MQADVAIPDVTAVDESSSDLTGVDSDDIGKHDQAASGEVDGGQPELTEYLEEKIPAAATPESGIAPYNPLDPPAEAILGFHQEVDAVSSPEESEPVGYQLGKQGEPKDETGPTKSVGDNGENLAEPDSDGSVMDLGEEEEVDTPQSPPTSSRRREGGTRIYRICRETNPSLQPSVRHQKWKLAINGKRKGLERSRSPWTRMIQVLFSLPTMNMVSDRCLITRSKLWSKSPSPRT